MLTLVAACRGVPWPVFAKLWKRFQSSLGHSIKSFLPTYILAELVFRTHTRLLGNKPSHHRVVRLQDNILFSMIHTVRRTKTFISLTRLSSFILTPGVSVPYPGPLITHPPSLPMKPVTHKLSDILRIKLLGLFSGRGDSSFPLAPST